MQFPSQLASAAPQTLLVVDDDADIRSLLGEQLEMAGYTVVTASGGPEMFAAMNSTEITLIILDLNLPGQDGLTLFRETRSRCDIPIIMLTARSGPIDRIVGLEVGADDYVIKPFEPRELIARVRSVMRRVDSRNAVADPVPPKRARFRGWNLDFENRRLIDPDEFVVMITGTEFSLLKFLVEHANEVVRREDLLSVTSPAASGDASLQRVDLHISRLRHKLKDSVRDQEIIKTIRNQGYILSGAVILE